MKKVEDSEQVKVKRRSDDNFRMIATVIRGARGNRRFLSAPLRSASSNYRVLGNVFADDLLISNWLAGKAIPTKS